MFLLGTRTCSELLDSIPDQGDEVGGARAYQLEPRFLPLPGFQRFDPAPVSGVLNVFCYQVVRQPQDLMDRPGQGDFCLLSRVAGVSAVLNPAAKRGPEQMDTQVRLVKGGDNGLGVLPILTGRRDSFQNLGTVADLVEQTFTQVVPTLVHGSLEYDGWWIFGGAACSRG